MANENESSNFIIDSSDELAKPIQESAASDEAEINEESETSETDDGGDDQSEQQEQDKPRKNGFKKRIDRLNRNLSEKDQRIALLQRDLEEARKTSTPKQEAQPQVSSESEPDPSNFETNAEYIKALNKHYRELDKAEAKKAEESGKQRETQEKVTKEYNSKLDSFKKSQPDFDDVVADFADKYGEFRASPAIIEALMTSDLGPNVLYEVLNDHAEYDRLSKLSESAIIREIGKIEARIALKQETSASNVQRQSKAPAPVSPAGRGGVPVTKSLNDPNISFAEYEQIRLKQLKSKK